MSKYSNTSNPDMSKMQGKELCQHWNAVWADRSDHSAYMTVKKHTKEKGKEFQTKRGWESIIVMYQGIVWTLKKNKIFTVSLSTQKTFTQDKGTHQHSADTCLLVQQISKQLLLAVSAPLHISIHRRTITYSAFWKNEKQYVRTKCCHINCLGSAFQSHYKN